MSEPRTPTTTMNRLPLPTEEEFRARLRRDDLALSPLKFKWEAPTVKSIDGAVRITWQKKTFRFAAEYRRLSNPKSILAAAGAVKSAARAAKLLPLVVVPFLDEQALDTLEAEAVSGIDLCGNGVVTVPGELYVRRTGNMNLFRAEGVIKNVYRKGSSVVARLFLARPEFDSVQDAFDELGRRGGRVTLSTVSKVCKRLEEDLVIERKRDGMTRLRLIQPEKLLDRLLANYSQPGVTRRQAGKLRGVEPSEFRKELLKWAESTGNQVSLTGTSSTTAYAVMARGESEEYYCTDVEGAVRALGDRFVTSERFATVSLIETRDDEVYFDRREDLTASPVQAFLELASGDKRDRQTADQVSRVILDSLPPVRPR
jgi:hypothetical protein